MRDSFKVTVDIRGEENILALLERLPKLVASEGGPLDRAVKAASNLIAKRARQLAPDGRKSGTRDKQSRKTKSKWPARLRSTIRSKIIKYPNGAWGVVGPKNPEGNAAHFMQEKPRRHVLWGKATLIKKFRIERNWITKAFDETKSEQLTAMETSLKQDIDANMMGI
jgi:hypothetical protein